MDSERSDSQIGINKGVGIVKNSFRVMSIAVVVGLLAAAFGLVGVFAQSSDTRVMIDEDQVKWGLTATTTVTAAVAYDSGDKRLSGTEGIAYVSPHKGADSTTGNNSSEVDFFVKDAALETFGTASRTFRLETSESVDGGATWNVADGTITPAGASDPTAALTATSSVMCGENVCDPGKGEFSTSTPELTPIKGGITATGNFGIKGSGPADVIVAINITSGSAKEITITFNYDRVDVYVPGTGTPTRRALVSSTVDSQGEYVTLTETGPTTQIFTGKVTITNDGSMRGRDSNPAESDKEVYVQDGSTLTVSYLSSTGSTIDTDTVTVDAAPPIFSDITPPKGTVTNSDRPSIGFTVTDDGSGLSTTPGNVIKLSINGNTSINPQFLTVVNGYRSVFGATASWASLYGADNSGDTGTPLVFTAEDEAGNKAEAKYEGDDLIIDTTKPTLVSARTGTKNTEIKVTFSETLDETSVTAADFTVDGVNPVSVSVVEDNTSTDDVNEAAQATLTVAALGTDDTPELKLVGDGVKDRAGNALITGTLRAEDGIAPIIVASAVDTALAVKDDTVAATLTANERLSANGVKMVLIGPRGSNINDELTPASSRPLEYRATQKVTGQTATGKYGVSMQITDITGTNSSDNLTKVTDEELTITNGMVTVSKTPIGDRNFDGALTRADVTLPAGVTAGVLDASAGTITITSTSTASNDGATIRVSYSYVKDDTFEVDKDAPAATFLPDGKTDIQDTSPYIRVTWDENEYPGDSYKTTTMTEATLTDPDGEETNILAGFQSGNDMEYLWSGSDLALGSYTLTVKGEDSADNEASATLTFKIVARAKTKVALRPGLNLISLPGMPASTAIDDVITNPDIDFVTTYDPRSASGFQSAVRGPDGEFGSGQTLSVIDGSKAYWVRTSSYNPLEIDIPGTGDDTGTIPPPVFRLAAGWNLVPVVAVAAGTTEVRASVYLSGVKASRIYEYDNEAIPPTLKRVVLDSANAANDGMLKVGRGYWVFLTEAGDLVP